MPSFFAKINLDKFARIYYYKLDKNTRNNVSC